MGLKAVSNDTIGTGTVTSVSVTTANGVSGSVANPTTTPAITLTLGNITPSNVTPSTGGAFRTGTTNANTALLQAYDVNDAVYRTFGTLTAGNTPSYALAAPSGGTVTIDGATIGATTAAAGKFTTLTTTSGTVDFQSATASTLNVTTTGTGTSSIELGNNLTGNAASFIDFHGDTTYTDYALRIIRGGGGANSASTIQHRGTGSLILKTEDAASILLQTNGANTRVTVDSTGDATFTGNIIGPKHIGGTGTTQTLTYQTTTGVGASGADHIFVVGNNGATEAMRIQNDGKVGVGIAAPQSQFHISRSASGAVANNLFLSNPNTATSTATNLIFNLSTTTSTQNASLVATRTNSPGQNATTLVFSTHNGTSLEEAFRATEAGNLQLATGKGLVTATSAGNTALIQAYDVDGTAYTTFGTLTANNTPTFDLSTAVTIGSNKVVGSSSTSVTDNTIVRMDSTTGSLIQSTGVTIDDNNALYGYKALINAQSGTTYTLNATDTGKIVEVSNGSAITLTLPNSLAVGHCCTVTQTGAGQITFSAAAGAAFHNRSSFTKTAGQYATVTLYVTTNSDNASAVYILSGDGA